MREIPFRFDPPPIEPPPELGWVLARAVGPPEAAVPEPEGSAAVALAERLRLAPRITARHSADRLAAELGAPAAGELRRLRALAAAQELRLFAALAAFDEIAAELRVPYAPLKGVALRLGGYSPHGGRDAADVDLLVPESKLETLQAGLVRRGFAEVGAAYEHQAPALRHAGGGAIELHRVALGVRLDGKTSAGLEALQADGQLGPPPASWGVVEGKPRGDLRLPRREFLVAHALVHALVQHGFAPDRYPGLVLIGDLIDLGFRDSSGRTSLAAIQPWIERAVPFAESQAALALASDLAAGRSAPEEAARGPARRLLDHFLAGALDPRYAEALKLRALEQPLSDRTLSGARAAVLAGALFPARGRDGGTGRESLVTYLVRVVRRPFDLVRRWRSAKAAARSRGSS